MKISHYNRAMTHIYVYIGYSDNINIKELENPIHTNTYSTNESNILFLSCLLSFDLYSVTFLKLTKRIARLFDHTANAGSYYFEKHLRYDSTQ